MKRLLWIAGIPLILAATVSADTLILRDGRRIDGQLLSFQNGVIEFQQSGFGGQYGRINKEEVLGIEFGQAASATQAPQRPQGPPRGMREKQIMVVANAPWTDTGIDLGTGQNIYFEATGNIHWGPGRSAGPAGEPNSPNNNARPIPNRAGGSLIGRVGPPDPFFIGDDRGAIRVRMAGRLYLGINDDVLSDNSGYFRVIVYY